LSTKKIIGAEELVNMKTEARQGETLKRNQALLRVLK
jgi:hypothetical protein